MRRSRMHLEDTFIRTYSRQSFQTDQESIAPLQARRTWKPESCSWTSSASGRSIFAPTELLRSIVTADWASHERSDGAQLCAAHALAPALPPLQLTPYHQISFLTLLSFAS